MTPPKAELGTLVQVTWTDANSMADQCTEAEVLALTTPLVHTFGILLEDSPERVVVVGELIEGPPETAYRNATVVPRPMVEQVQRLVFLARP